MAAKNQPTPTFDHGRASNTVKAVIDDQGNWSWSLQVNTDGEVYAVRSIKFDGQKYITTRDRQKPRSRSEYGLDARRVVERYVAVSETPYSAGELYDAVEAALERDH